ncbi:molybdopterin-dependent oxidoreductase [Halobellus limi]|uniref:Molybdopterin-binding oxidoreductase n=1 Tax=Halobellus limi TaxID=699433 RepID=A0A1H5WFE2_9EURY|nr:molybdopterin-dependent oxidoreductase [Halobellus limi]QCC46463.1 molybdopterin-binding oxidoreductase [Halobellus limi]SEF97996.1 Oxidoreductase molybdopterin binding domain-containing protein [Halobellus limi]
MTATPDAHVTVDGESSVRIPVPLPADHGHETATVEGAFRCSTGDLIAEEWTGLAVDALLLDADAPDETTHVQVAGEDGFTVCVPVGAALDGVLSFAESGESVESDPRFAAPGVSGTRTVKGVRRVRPITLDPSEHPEEREELNPAESDDE